MIIYDCNLALYEFLYVFEVGLFFTVAKGKGGAVGPGATGATNAVNIRLRNVGQVVVDDVLQTVNINASGGNIGGHQNAGGLLLKIAQCILPGILRLIAVYGFCRNLALLKYTHHLIGPVFGTGKDQYRTDGLIFKHFLQELNLVGLVYKINKLIDGFGCGRCGGHLYLHRLMKNGVGQLHDIGRHGGREKERLAFCGQNSQKPFNIVNKAHVEHAVGLIQHKNLNFPNRYKFLIHQVEQATGGGDQNIHAVFEGLDLTVLIYAAKNDGAAQTGMSAIIFDALPNLNGELTSRCYDEGTYGAATALVQTLIIKQLQYWNGKGSRFTGTGLGATQ